MGEARFAEAGPNPGKIVARDRQVEVVVRTCLATQERIDAPAAVDPVPNAKATGEFATVGSLVRTRACR